MNLQIETRFLSMELEAATNDSGAFIIRGVSPVFNAISDVLVDAQVGAFREVIEPGALDEVLKNAPDVRGRFDHKVVLGRTKNGTLFLNKTDAGLAYEIFVNSSDPEAMAAYEKVRRKDVDGASFMFIVAQDGESWEVQEDGIPLRRVKRIVELLDVGPVSYPAYPQASASARDKCIELRQQSQQTQPNEPEGADGASHETDQKAVNDTQALELMAMELELDETKE